MLQVCPNGNSIPEAFFFHPPAPSPVPNASRRTHKFRNKAQLLFTTRRITKERATLENQERFHRGSVIAAHTQSRRVTLGPFPVFRYAYIIQSFVLSDSLSLSFSLASSPGYCALERRRSLINIRLRGPPSSRFAPVARAFEARSPPRPGDDREDDRRALGY